MVSNTIGARRQEDVLPLIKRICLLNLGIVVLMGIITLANSKLWIGLIASQKDMSLITETVMPLIVLVCALPVCSLGTVLFNSISGTANTRIALIFEMITLVFYISAMYVIVIHNKSSVAMCWTVEYVYWGTLMVLSYLYLTRGKWQNKSI